MTVLRLLDQVSWDGHVVTSDRSLALLAVLAHASGATVSETAIAEAVWGPDDQPATPGKALQVVVSRTRTQTRPDLVVRAERGYRLGVDGGQVDYSCLTASVQAARRAEAEGDLVGARNHARAALGITVADPGSEPIAVEELRDLARTARDQASRVLGRTACALGDHTEAFGLLADVDEPDEATLAALLRSEAAVHGAPIALTRYERHREHVRDTLGVDPGPDLQRLHAELLAADNPVRVGLRYEATSLVGRDEDIRALRAAVGESRVVSILGPGGLGKTRLAHLLGREAEQPVVHFVELVGVTAADDVVEEVGSALGVRDSVSGRRVLTPEQRSDVRSRIAQQLDHAPTLLILDNCEHVVGAVAELVAFLVATTRNLRVVTTTRSPLAIAAERVFPLDQLSDDAAADLFRQRAQAARPGLRLDDDAVLRVVRRLDGLPLAVELAAARVRVMSVDDIDRRLDDRFTLLRGTDRSAPDRHQTLVAVIDWSWNLLGPAERRALAHLSVFHDGFALTSAEAVIGPEAMRTVESLVDQSLVNVVDGRLGVRYRMLETVREFGRLRLEESGGTEAAHQAQVSWARSLCAGAEPDLYSPRQFDVIDALAEEENNLADVLRHALAHADLETTVRVLGSLGTYWTIKGEHTRVMAITAAVEEVLVGWTPNEELRDPTIATAVLVTMNNTITDSDRPRECRRLLDDLGATASSPQVRAMAAVLTTLDPADLAGSVARLEALQASADRHVALCAFQWSTHGRENLGDPEGAISAAVQALALWQEDDGPWSRALMLTQLAELEAQLGRSDRAAVHAMNALPVLDRLEANDDAIGVRGILAYAAMNAGRIEEAERLIEEIDGIDSGGFAADIAAIGSRAELALYRGDLDGGLLLFRESIARLRALSFPGMAELSGYEPWVLFGEGSGTVAYALYGHGEDGADLYRLLRSKVAKALDPDRPAMDFPIAGLVLYGLGSWGLLREALPIEDAVRLLVLAQRFSYSRFTPTLAWELTAEPAERLAPGLLAEIAAEYGDRRGPALLDEARAQVQRIFGTPVVEVRRALRGASRPAE